MKARIIRFMCTALLITIFVQTSNAKKRKQSAQSNQEQTSYKPRTFDFESLNLPFSKSQMDQHYKLYVGYVNKRNEIDEKLQTVDRANVANVTYSPFRALKISQVFAHNGSVLHEFYFENLNAPSEPQEKTKELLDKNFGSLEAFKQDLLDSASCARGWVITAYCLDDGRIKNFVLDAHHLNVPVFVIPILVVDTYEHAYMIDYGINRADYLKDMWNSINWDIVEQRVNKWIK